MTRSRNDRSWKRKERASPKGSESTTNRPRRSKSLRALAEKRWEHGEPVLEERIPAASRRLSASQLRDLNDEWRQGHWFAPRDALELEEVLLA